VDAAPKKDTTAVAMVQRDDTGLLNVRVWVFRADPDVGYLNYGEVEELLRQLGPGTSTWSESRSTRTR